MKINTVGSVCSGIEAASVAWPTFNFKWFSEIEEFPSKLLAEKYPHIPNIGDMRKIPELINNGEIVAPDLICGGTPCQAFSMAGLMNGLDDDRGNLTLSFVRIADASDKIRINNNQNRSIVFWENVEGVLKDKTNAFGSLVSSLAGLEEIIKLGKWPNAGVIHGPKRNVAWRTLDAKYFGVPQQRKRVYLLAGKTDFFPENVLFERYQGESIEFNSYNLKFQKDGTSYEVFREYTDTLYAAYGTKWNGNAAAQNGSLFVVQNDQLRRLSPLECERLMGFPDGYTDIDLGKQKRTRTSRYKALGNSWVIPLIRWIGSRIENPENDISELISEKLNENGYVGFDNKDVSFYSSLLNTSIKPNNVVQSTMVDIVDNEAPEKIYITPVGCSGILRRSVNRKTPINKRLEMIMRRIAMQMSPEEIEKISRKQIRGRFSQIKESHMDTLKGHLEEEQLSLF
jgi:DNA (cytosine-5)-methyltransferase 1